MSPKRQKNHDKEIKARHCICGKLQFEVAKNIGRIQFLLLEYHFFKDSNEGSALPLSLPLPLFFVSLMVHIFKTHALTLLRLPCYFVKLEKRIVGLFAIEEHHESLLIASLGVAKEYRRLGIGTCILGFIEADAKHSNKKWLEVAVWRRNIPAQQLYMKYGFRFTQSGRTINMMKMILS